MTIFKSNPRASKLNTIYLDAFAGTGYRNPEKADRDSLPFLIDDNDAKKHFQPLLPLIIKE